MEGKQIRRILVVDDEPNIVSAVQRELNAAPQIRYQYAVEGFTDPAQALERARNHMFDAVICDYRMPGMDGLAFLKALTAIQPDCARLVLSGQTDMDALARMVNETHIYRFVPKPWHDYYLKGSLAQALDYAGVLQENRRLAEMAKTLGTPVPPLDDVAIEQVLIVDDDPGVLSSLSRVLTRHSRVDDLFSAIRAEIANRQGPALEEGRISVQVTPSARHALKMAETVEYSCILADFRMAEMNGVELLQGFLDRQPDCARIIISGNLSEDDLIYAVDSAHIFAFIPKPWSDYELKACIALAISQRHMQRENRMLAEMVKKSGNFAAP